MDDLVMKLREVEAPQCRFGFGDDSGEIRRLALGGWANIPEAAATLLFEEGFVPTSFGREHNPAQDEHLPTIWFETVESVAARGEGTNQ